MLNDESRSKLCAILHLASTFILQHSSFNIPCFNIPCLFFASGAGGVV